MYDLFKFFQKTAMDKTFETRAASLITVEQAIALNKVFPGITHDLTHMNFVNIKCNEIQSVSGIRF